MKKTKQPNLTFLKSLIRDGFVTLESDKDEERITVQKYLNTIYAKKIRNGHKDQGKAPQAKEDL